MYVIAKLNCEVLVETDDSSFASSLSKSIDCLLALKFEGQYNITNNNET